MNYNTSKIEVLIEGNSASISIKKNGKKHNRNGPAYYLFDYNGDLYIEKYYAHGLLHRLFGPAVIEYDENKSVIYSAHYIFGIIHNFYFWKPACVSFYADGSIEYKKYFFFGFYYAEKHYGPEYSNIIEKI